MDEAGFSRVPVKEGDDPSRSPDAPLAQRRRWVILPAIPRVEYNERKFLAPGTDLSLEFAKPPRTSILTVPRRIHVGDPDPYHFHRFPYVIDVHSSGRFLLYTVHGRGLYDSDYYLCDAHTRVATLLPPCIEYPIFPRRSIGLIEDPRHPGHFMVAQLHPTPTIQHKILVSYSTLSNAWVSKNLSSCPEHQLWGSHGGVIAHDGKLWWVDLPYGLLTCDPFAEELQLRYVALPEGCVMVDSDTNSPTSRDNIDKHRCVKVSEGKLRFVEIHYDMGHAVSMWTLADLEGPVWDLEYEVRLDEIWGDDSYRAAGLLPEKVPAIALIDPNNHGVLYFFQNALLFAVDMRASANRILGCNKYLTGNEYEVLQEFHSARFIHAWEMAPTTHPRSVPSSDPTKMSDDLSSMRSLAGVLSGVNLSDEGSESSRQPSVDASDQNDEQ
ncbi:hypothetical protein GUJ93_ZPchr0008g11725 [Zizania palustris]|uniref:DUF1618 domain-containing protein n=1 Tax=Zizania palustris TaxID=103762 RepID=A0A8J5RID5_ZIZPA|nr:hypothetical protein GUJ93_ZPchr0008g11725 [Zizania palustris]